MITVFLTAFYTFRMFFLVFHGKFRGPAVSTEVEVAVTHEVSREAPHPTAHESDWWMVVPLIVLAVPAVLIGLWGSPVMNNGFQRLLEGSAYIETPINLPLALLGAVLALAGIGTAWMMYGARQFVVEPLARFGAVYSLLAHRYYIDEFYEWLIDKLVIGVGFGLAIFDRQALDGLVNGFAAAVASAGQRSAHNTDGPRTELRAGAVRWHGRHRRGAGHRAAGARVMLDPTVGRIVLQLVLWLPLVGAVIVALAGGSERPWRIATGLCSRHLHPGGVAIDWLRSLPCRSVPVRDTHRLATVWQ